MPDDVQATDKPVEVKRARNSPTGLKQVWLKARMEFEAGSYQTLKELAHRHGLSHQCLRNKICREKWTQRQITLQDKVERKVESDTVSRVSEYLSNTFLRAKKYERMLDASQDQAGSKLADGTPVLDGDLLDAYTRSEARIHELAKSALRIPAVAQVDITSKGQSVGESIVSAIARLRESGTAPTITDAQAARILEMEVVK